MDNPERTENVQRQIGFSRPALAVEDLPTPEQVFKTRRIGLQEMILFVLGPSVIALGVSLGSGEWLLGPRNVSLYGFKGIGWVILVSAILQVFYNVELGRYTLATGEAPVVGFGRTPPGYWVWVPLALFSFYMAFILGGWTVSAGEALFALIAGRAYQPQSELELVRILGILLLGSVFIFLMFGRKIERTMEAIQGIYLPYVLIGLVLITLVVVPLNFWGQGLAWLIIPARPPSGTDPSLLGALAGFTALASGLNFMFIGYYRDKGYGMGSKTGYIPSLLSRRSAKPGADGNPSEHQAISLRPDGVTFAETPENAVRWQRWFRYLLIDQWGIYFGGVLLGMFLPSLLVAYLSSLPGSAPISQASLMTYAAEILGKDFGPLLSGWTLFTGFILLYSTQMVVLELMARNFTDAAFALSPRLRKRVNEDPRRIYYPAVIGLIVLISFFIHLRPPEQLLVISANLSNFAALLFPLALMYLNSRLPRPARIRWWSYLVLLLNVAFFGFFFINFLFTLINGVPLVRF